MGGGMARVWSAVAIGALFIGGLMGLAIVGDAHRDAASAVALPDTPAGRQMEWVLDAVANPPPERVIEARLTEDFRRELPASELLNVFRDMRAGGPYTVTAVEISGEYELVVMLDGRGTRFRTSIVVEAEGLHLISRLFFAKADPAARPVKSWDALDRRLREAASEVGFLAAEIVDGRCRPVHALEADAPLSLASASRLYVLGAAADAVEAGRLSWDTPIEIRDEARVHGSTRSDAREAGERVPLGQLARDMIESVDNTAGDLVLEAVGRDAVEAVQAEMGMADPERNLPFLTMRELSLIKWTRQTLLDEFVALDEAGRRKLLAERLADRPAKVRDVLQAHHPVAVETVEWFASASDLCRAHLALQDKDQTVRRILGDKPRIPLDPDAAYVAYRGGTEPGVLAGSWYIEHEDGRRFAISLLLRDAEHLIEVSALSFASDALRLLSGSD